MIELADEPDYLSAALEFGVRFRDHNVFVTRYINHKLIPFEKWIVVWRIGDDISIHLDKSGYWLHNGLGEWNTYREAFAALAGSKGYTEKRPVPIPSGWR